MNFEVANFKQRSAWKTVAHAAKDIHDQKEKETFRNEAYMDRVRLRDKDVMNRIAEREILDNQ